MASLIRSEGICTLVWLCIAASILSPISRSDPPDREVQRTHHAGLVPSLPMDPTQLKAVRIWRQLGGQYGSYHYYGLMNLRVLFKNPGDLTRAQAAFREALKLNESALGPRHRATVAAMTRLAETLAMSGNLAEAQGLLEKALEYAIPEGLEGAQTLNDLSFLYAMKGRNDDAARLLSRATRIVTAASAADAVEWATGLANVAALRAIRGETSQAEPLLQKALKACEPVLANDPQLGVILTQRGMLRVSGNRHVAAIEDLTRAAGIFRTSRGANSRELAMADFNLAGAYMSDRQLDAAERLFVEAIAIRRSLDSRDDPDVTTMLIELDQCRVRQRLTKSGKGVTGASRPASKIIFILLSRIQQQRVSLLSPI